MALFTACAAAPSVAEKKKVVFIMGATGTGKTKLSICLAKQFPSEIINSDKIQAYKGLDIITNKVTQSQRSGIPHHMVDIIDDPEYDFTIDEFCKHILVALDIVTENGHLPIIVGGSNTYLTALLQNPNIAFRSKYDCCFIWLDASLTVMFPYLHKRVEEMVDAGVVEEIREDFVVGADYTRGVRRTIGVRELGEYFLLEKEMDDDAEKDKMFQHAIAITKDKTCKLAERQVLKIHKMKHDLGLKMSRIDSTEVLEAALKGVDYNHLYEEIVFKPSMKIIKEFLEEAPLQNENAEQAKIDD